MKIRLLIAARDSDYVEHLSKVLLSKYADSFEVSVCFSPESLPAMLEQHSYDVAVLDDGFLNSTGNIAARLSLLLWSGAEDPGILGHGVQKLRKYQRISAIASQILAQYAEISNQGQEFGDRDAVITVVWSPVGGSGKTTVALAYGAYLSGQGKKVVYLDLEPFASTPVYFSGQGPGLSSVFEKLQDGNIGLLLQSIRLVDSGSSILYFNRPDNYEDISILMPDDIALLIRGAASGADEVIADMGSGFDQRIQQTMELSNQVFLVADASAASQVKCEQFRSQHSLYEQIADKLTLIANRGASRGSMGAEENVLMLPVVQSENPIVVYKTLSGYFQRLAAK